MTTPARTQPGRLGTLAYLAGGTVEFPDYAPNTHATQVVFFVRADAAGELTILRVLDEVESLQIPIQALVALAPTDDEYTIILDYPIVGKLRLSFENTDATAGAITVDVTHAGQGSAGR